MDLNAEKFYKKIEEDESFVKAILKTSEEIFAKVNATDIQQYNSFVQNRKIRLALSKESDRGCVLLAVSYLEDVLGKYILSYLNGSSKFKKDFLRTNLSSFNSRINFAYSVGLINESLMKDFNILRDIRNKFAHSFDILNFENEGVIELMSRLN